jgi:hypothetical protein
MTDHLLYLLDKEEPPITLAKYKKCMRIAKVPQDTQAQRDYMMAIYDRTHESIPELWEKRCP